VLYNLQQIKFIRIFRSQIYLILHSSQWSLTHSNYSVYLFQFPAFWVENMLSIQWKHRKQEWKGPWEKELYSGNTW